MKQTVSRPWTMAVCMLILGGGYAQVTTPFNQPSGAGNFVGWDNSVTEPLRVRHDGNQPIEWYTDAIQRMMLYPTQTNAINTFNVVQDGFLGLSERPGFFTGTPGPFSRLHLVDGIGANDPNIYAQFGSFRPWMRNGVTFTGNADHRYVGQKHGGNDNMDLVNLRSDKQRLRRPRSETTVGCGPGYQC